MANTINGNTFFVDSDSVSGTVGSFMNMKDLLIESFVLSAATNAVITISDLKYENATYTAGDAKMVLNVRANDTVALFLDATPIKCPNGIWISGSSGNPKLTLVVKFKG